MIGKEPPPRNTPPVVIAIAPAYALDVLKDEQVKARRVLRSQVQFSPVVFLFPLSAPHPLPKLGPAAAAAAARDGCLMRGAEADAMARSKSRKLGVL